MGNKQGVPGKYSHQTIRQMARQRFEQRELDVLKPAFRDLASRSGLSGAQANCISKHSFLRLMGITPGILGDRLFEAFDMKQDGVVDYDEFLLSCCMYARGDWEEKGLFALRLFDLSGDGKVTRSEMETLLISVFFSYQVALPAGMDPRRSPLAALPLLPYSSSNNSSSSSSSSSTNNLGGQTSTPFKGKAGAAATEDEQLAYRIRSVVDTAFEMASEQEKSSQCLEPSTFITWFHATPSVVLMLDLAFSVQSGVEQVSISRSVQPGDHEDSVHRSENSVSYRGGTGGSYASAYSVTQGSSSFGVGKRGKSGGIASAVRGKSEKGGKESKQASLPLSAILLPKPGKLSPQEETSKLRGSISVAEGHASSSTNIVRGLGVDDNSSIHTKSRRDLYSGLGGNNGQGGYSSHPGNMPPSMNATNTQSTGRTCKNCDFSLVPSHCYCCGKKAAYILVSSLLPPQLPSTSSSSSSSSSIAPLSSTTPTLAPSSHTQHHPPSNQQQGLAITVTSYPLSFPSHDASPLTIIPAPDSEDGTTTNMGLISSALELNASSIIRGTNTAGSLSVPTLNPTLLGVSPMTNTPTSIHAVTPTSTIPTATSSTTTSHDLITPLPYPSKSFGLQTNSTSTTPLGGVSSMGSGSLGPMPPSSLSSSSSSSSSSSLPPSSSPSSSPPSTISLVPTVNMASTAASSLALSTGLAIYQPIEVCSSCRAPHLQYILRHCIMCGYDATELKVEPPLTRQPMDRTDLPVMKGWLSKQGARLRTLKDRWFVLTDSFLYSYHAADDYTPVHVYYMEGCFVEPVNHEYESTKLKYGIEIIFNEDPRISRFLYCKTATQRDQWVRCLRLHANVHSIEDFYKLDQEIGIGQFASVVRAISKANGKRYAVKVLEKSDMDEKGAEALRTEVAVLKLVRHPRVIRLKNVFESRRQIHLVMQYVPGGDLFQLIKRRKRLNESLTQTVMGRLLDVVRYLHQRGIVHRDLKPENILVTFESDMSGQDRDNDLYDDATNDPTTIAPTATATAAVGGGGGGGGMPGDDLVSSSGAVPSGTALGGNTGGSNGSGGHHPSSSTDGILEVKGDHHAGEPGRKPTAGGGGGGDDDDDDEGHGVRDDFDIILADFGLSKFAAKDSPMTMACGTLAYVAPEVLSRHGYGFKVDLWSCGVIMYLMLSGRLPFDGNDASSIIPKISSGTYSLESSVWREVTPECKDLVKRLLTVNPDQRLDAFDALNHPWFLVDPETYSANSAQGTSAVGEGGHGKDGTTGGRGGEEIQTRIGSGGSGNNSGYLRYDSMSGSTGSMGSQVMSTSRLPALLTSSAPFSVTTIQRERVRGRTISSARSHGNLSGQGSGAWSGSDLRATGSSQGSQGSLGNRNDATERGGGVEGNSQGSGGNGGEGSKGGENPNDRALSHGPSGIPKTPSRPPKGLMASTRGAPLSSLNKDATTSGGDSSGNNSGISSGHESGLSYSSHGKRDPLRVGDGVDSSNNGDSCSSSSSDGSSSGLAGNSGSGLGLPLPFQSTMSVNSTGSTDHSYSQSFIFEPTAATSTLVRQGLSPSHASRGPGSEASPHATRQPLTPLAGDDTYPSAPFRSTFPALSGLGTNLSSGLNSVSGVNGGGVGGVSLDVGGVTVGSTSLDPSLPSQSLGVSMSLAIPIPSPLPPAIPSIPESSTTNGRESMIGSPYQSLPLGGLAFGTSNQRNSIPQGSTHTSGTLATSNELVGISSKSSTPPLVGTVIQKLSGSHSRDHNDTDGSGGGGGGGGNNEGIGNEKAPGNDHGAHAGNEADDDDFTYG